MDSSKHALYSYKIKNKQNFGNGRGNFESRKNFYSIKINTEKLEI